MSDGVVERLYQAIAANDPAAAIAVVSDAKAHGIPQDRLFGDVYIPALAMLGAAWAAGEIDEFRFTEAAVVAEQVTSFVTLPPAAPDRGVTVVLGAAEGDRHDLRKNIFAAALKTAGFRVLDLGVDTSPEEFLSGVDETGSRVAIVFAETVGSAGSVGGIRRAFDEGGRSDTLLLVSGGPFEADPGAAKVVGANGVANTAQGILRLVERVVADRLGGGA